MPFAENGTARLYYEEAGSGFPLLVIPGGGLNSRIANWTNSPFNTVEEFKSEYHVVTMDQRNAMGGQSTGPLGTDDPWGDFARDQLAVLDAAGVDRFMAIGFCIGGPFLLKLMEMAPNRIVAGVLAQPVGHRPESPTVMHDHGIETWAPAFLGEHNELSMDDVEAYLEALYARPGDFVYSVDRDFVRGCQTPLLVLPDDVPAHSYEVALEVAAIAPHGEKSMYPWKEPRELIPDAVALVRRFLKANAPAEALARQ